MASVTEADLTELKELIQKQTEQLNTLSRSQTEQFQTISQEINELRISVGKIEATLQTQQPLIQKIPDLAEKVGELKNWKQIVIISITALIGGVIGWLVRGGRI